MACIVYRTDPATGAKYAYRSESYRDPVTRKPRNRKEYLGRVDPETGEIRPKRARGGARARPAEAPEGPSGDPRAGLEAELASVTAERDALAASLDRLRASAEALAAEARAALAGIGA